MKFGESVRFPAAAEAAERLRALGSREPAATIYLSLHADGREVASMGAVLVLLNTALVVNRIEGLASERSDEPMEMWDLMRKLATALFDGHEQDVVMEAINSSENRVKE